MSSRFNPVAFLRSRSKSKSRSESVQSRDTSNQENEFVQRESKRHLFGAHFSRRSTTLPNQPTRPRFRLFTSFRRRSRSSKRDTHRSDSVPPVELEEHSKRQTLDHGILDKPLEFDAANPLAHMAKTHFVEVANIPDSIQMQASEEHSKQEPEADSTPEIPLDVDVSNHLAPLAKTDLFETAEHPDFDQTNGSDEVVEEEGEFEKIAEDLTSQNSASSSKLTRDQSSEQSSEIDNETVIELGDTLSESDDYSSTNFEDLYHTEYPKASGSESIDSIAETLTEGDQLSTDMESDNIDSHAMSDHEEIFRTNTTDQPLYAGNQSIETSEEDGSYKPSGDSGWKPLDAVMSGEAEYSEVDNTVAIEDDAYYSHDYQVSNTGDPDIVVTHDPAQDPFHEAELAANEEQWTPNEYHLGTPSIIVTSASTGSLNLYTENGKAPDRPPLPSAVLLNKESDSHKPPPRPPAVQLPEQVVGTSPKKKKKLFGLVDIGPLPTDPDPNFPFRKHLEKSVVPNPRKALQRIIRGETKAERRQRKEKEEVAKLLQAAPNAPEHVSGEVHSKDWEDFQALTQQIDQKVQETTFKVIGGATDPFQDVPTANDSVAPTWADFDSGYKQREIPLESTNNNVEPESWANFEAAFKTDEPLHQNSQEHAENGTYDPAEGSDDPWQNITGELDNGNDFFKFEAFQKEESFSSDVLGLDTKVEMDDSLIRRTHAEMMKDIDDILGIEMENVIGTSEETTNFVNANISGEDDKPVDAIAHDQSSIEQTPRQTSSELSEESDQEEKLYVQKQPEETTPGTTSPEEETDVNDPGESKSSEGMLQPEQEPLGPSDNEDEADNILWGGFGEVQATPQVASPFGEEDFCPSNGAGEPESKEFDPSFVRPRSKPIRQTTLSGNNPFRAVDTDNGLDELYRAATSIELTNANLKQRTQRDSFADSDSTEESGKLVAKENSDGNDENMILGGFDPLQTIYPESDNESITIKTDHANSTHEVVNASVDETKQELGNDELPITEAATELSQNDLDISVSFQETESERKDEITKDTTTPGAQQTLHPGWIDFNEDLFLDDQHRPLASPDLISEVDWTAPIAKPEPQEPEPPRPDTPDPELDKPFYPPVEDNVFYRLWLRFPEKKTRVKQVSKYTTDRYWKEIALSFSEEHGRKVINLHEVDEKSDHVQSEPYRSIRIEPYMQLSREKLQQYDKYGKLHVFKLNHVSYREMVGMRPEKFSLKHLQKLVTHKPKQNVAVDHIPVYSEILKFGSLDQQKIRTLMPVFEDALMKIPAHKDTTLSYSREEVCCYVVDEYHASVSSTSNIIQQKARTRILCTAFVNGGPHIVLGLNDKWRYGREVVRRSDILPVMHDEWISIRNPEFHSCVEMDAYEKDHMLKFYPLDGCRFELLRFRVSLRENQELPMFVKIIYRIDGRRVSMRCELLVPGFFSASHRKGAVPCENVEIHIPVPEEWIYHFRIEKHHKYGSVHSTLRKPGRIKGLERITQMAQSLLPTSILEASTGLAKYEHLYKAIVWRIPRIPEKGEATMRPHLLTCKLNLAPHDEVPSWDSLVRESQVEYTMPSSTVSGATVRSISVEHTGVAEKFVKYTSKYRYTVEIDYQLGERKPPPLKSVLDDETTLPAEPEVKESEPNTEQVPYEQGNETTDNGIGDLLGLGEELTPSILRRNDDGNETTDITEIL